MKASASPKPASGPVFGLTWPILITADCAFAGSMRSTAGAASAPMPALTRVRREIVFPIVIVSSLVFVFGSAGGIAAVGIENVSRVKVGRFGGEEEQGTCQIFRLAQPPLRH